MTPARARSVFRRTGPCRLLLCATLYALGSRRTRIDVEKQRTEVADARRYAPDGGVLLDKHADAAAGGGASVLWPAARLELRRAAGSRPRGEGGGTRNRRP